MLRAASGAPPISAQPPTPGGDAPSALGGLAPGRPAPPHHLGPGGGCRDHLKGSPEGDPSPEPLAGTNEELN